MPNVTRTLWCAAGDHNWERPVTRGRLPINCPEHSLDLDAPERQTVAQRLLEGRRRAAERRAQAEQEAVQQRVQQQHERVANATQEVERTYAALIKAGGVNKAPVKIFNTWYNAESRLLGQVVALRAAESALERQYV